MFKYILKRVLLMIPVIMAVILAVYLMLNSVSFGRGLYIQVLQGDWFDHVLSFLHVTDSWLGQYLRYTFNALVKFDLGVAGETGWRISYEVSTRLGYTLILTLLGLFTVIVIGVPLGIHSAVYSGRSGDKVISSLSLLLSSMPSYVMAIMLVLVFAVNLGVLPPLGITSWKSYIMPVLVLSFDGIAQTVRVTRSIVLETLDRQFVTALRSKGLAERAVIYGHVLRNSVIPIISLLSQTATKVLCGSIIVESFFSIPGIGQYLIAAVRQRSFARILGSSVLIAVIVMTINIIADVLYILVNPAVRMNVLGSGKKVKNNV